MQKNRESERQIQRTLRKVDQQQQKIRDQGARERITYTESTVGAEQTAQSFLPAASIPRKVCRHDTGLVAVFHVPGLRQQRAIQLG